MSRVPPTQDIGAREPTVPAPIRSTVWVVLGYSATQALRLGTNLIMTRLLVPEFFGLMALVQIFTQAAEMLSDIGLRPSVVAHKRGDEPLFLNTAWTVQVIRGLVLWIAICVAAEPAGALYGEPMLHWLLPVVGLSVFISGFASTAPDTMVRQVNMGRNIASRFASSLFGMVVMIAWAIVEPSLWALIAGNLSTSLAHVVLSHFLIRGYKNRFALDRNALRDIVQFGKWILVSTALAFVLSQADRIALGKLLTRADLGVYTIAVVLAWTAVQVVQALSASVLFPLWARTAREAPNRLRRSASGMRIAILILGLSPLWILGLFGQEIVDFLYDVRYAGAGWMVQILAFGAMARVLNATGEGMFLAREDSYRYMWAQFAQATSVVAGLIIGGYVAGVPGVLIGISTAHWMGYAAVATLLTRQYLWRPEVDVPVIVVSGLVLWVEFGLS